MKVKEVCKKRRRRQDEEKKKKFSKDFDDFYLKEAKN